MKPGASAGHGHLSDLAAALAAIEAGDDAGARGLLDRAAQRGSLMGKSLGDVLRRGGARNAYDEPRAFETFVRGGGNVPLYASVSSELARQYDALRPDTLLDIGAGDGMALVPAVAASESAPGRIDVVEPNEGLLSTLRASLPSARAHRQTLERFVAGMGDSDRWNLAQATFALQSIEPKARGNALATLAGHVDRLLIVEFDVPRLMPGTAEHYASLADRYERAASEYGGDAELVAGGFLAPMLLGQLRSIVPSNYEQPAEAWAAELQEAGYRVTAQSDVHEYSWSMAFCMTAVPRD
jgi:hypothetical protein